MRVELGNASVQEIIEGVRHDVDGLRVSYLNIPEGTTLNGPDLYLHPEVDSDDLYPADLAAAFPGVNDAARALLINGWLGHPDRVHGLPNHEAFVAVVHPAEGFWQAVSKPSSKPTWVWSDSAALQRDLAKFYGVPEGRPADVEDTHITQRGAIVYPAGASPDPLGEIVALHVNVGRDIQAVQMFGFGFIGQTGVGTASSSSTFTLAAGTSHAANDCAYQWIFVGPNTSGTGSSVYGLILSNTSGTTSVITVDQWYAAATPGSATPGVTPNATGSYVIASGGPPQLFVGLSANTSTVNATDTTLTGEITTAGGGLIRKIAPIGHTAGTTTVTMTPVYTANGTDSLPVTIGKAGASASILSTPNNSYLTLVSPTATLSSSGDQLTLTWTYTMT